MEQKVEQKLDQDIFVAGYGGPTRQLPWSDWQQWEQVFRQLFSNNVDEQWNAVKIISAWESRGKVPVSVHSTRAILELLLKDKLEQGYSWKVEHHSDLERRLSFSMAIVRLVNGLAEGSQKGVFAKPISWISNQIGIPPYLVELRHDATHKYLPTLQVLRHACQDSVQWLYQNYWLPQYNAITNARLKLIQSIDEYRNVKFEIEVPDQRTDLKQIIKSIVSVSLSEIKDILIPLFIDNDYIIPTSKTYKKNKTLPSKVLDIWQQLLLECGKETPSFYMHLVYALLTRFLDKANTPVDHKLPDILKTKIVEYKNQYYKCWLLHLLEEFEIYLPDPSASEKGEVVLCLKTCLNLCLNYEGDSTVVSEIIYLLFYNINKIDDSVSMNDSRYRKMLILYSDAVLLSNGRPYKGDSKEDTEDQMDDQLELSELEALIMSKSNNSFDMEMKDTTMWTPQDNQIASLATFGDTHQSFDLPSRLDTFNGPVAIQKREETPANITKSQSLSTGPSKRRLSDEDMEEEVEEEEVLPKKKKLEKEPDTIKLLLPFDLLTKRLSVQ